MEARTYPELVWKRDPASAKTVDGVGMDRSEIIDLGLETLVDVLLELLREDLWRRIIDFRSSLDVVARADT